VLKGRYGPYVTDKKKNAKVPKDREPASLTLEECQALLAAAPERKGRFGRRAKAAAPAADAAPAPAPADAAKVKAEPKRAPRKAAKKKPAAKKSAAAGDAPAGE
jgi:DNA topoisomerase-1